MPSTSHQWQTVTIYWYLVIFHSLIGLEPKATSRVVALQNRRQSGDQTGSVLELLQSSAIICNHQHKPSLTWQRSMFFPVELLSFAQSLRCHLLNSATQQAPKPRLDALQYSCRDANKTRVKWRLEWPDWPNRCIPKRLAKRKKKLSQLASIDTSLRLQFPYIPISLPHLSSYILILWPIFLSDFVPHQAGFRTGCLKSSRSETWKLVGIILLIHSSCIVCAIIFETLKSGGMSS